MTTRRRPGRGLTALGALMAAASALSIVPVAHATTEPPAPADPPTSTVAAEQGAPDDGLPPEPPRTDGDATAGDPTSSGPPASTTAPDEVPATSLVVDDTVAPDTVAPDTATPDTATSDTEEPDDEPPSDTSVGPEAPGVAPGTPELSAAVWPHAETNQVMLTWTVADEETVTSFVIRRLSPGQGPIEIATVAGSARSHVVGSLAAGVPASFEIAAENEHGTSAWSTAVAATPIGVPAAPIGLAASADASRQIITLNWRPPTSVGGSPLTRFVVERSLDGTGWQRTLTLNASTTRAEIGSLVPLHLHRFRVAAESAAGLGPWATVTATIPTPAWAANRIVSGRVTTATGQPIANAAVHLTDVSTSQIVETYSREDGTFWLHPPAATYTLWVRAAGYRSEYYPDAPIASAATRIAVTSSSPRTNIALSLAAAAAPTVPLSVRSSVSPAGQLWSGQVRIDWNLPSDLGGEHYYRFEVEYSVDQRTWTLATEEQRSSTVGGLTNGTRYWFRVRARNSVGASPWVVVTAVPRSWVPPAPADFQAGGLPSPAGAATGRVSLYWQAPYFDPAVTGYVLQRSTNGTNWITIPTPRRDSEFGYVVSGLIPGQTYSFRVASRNAVGVGPFTPPRAAIPPAVPFAPTLSARATGPGRVRLDWTAPRDSGSRITAYVVERSANGGSTWTRVAQTAATARAVDIGGLTVGRSYRFRVTAINGVGRGRSSIVVTVVSTAVPTAPTTMTLAVSPTATSVAWGRPTAGSATSYVVQRSHDGRTWVTVGTTTTTSMRFAPPTVGTRTYVRVAGRNGAGTGGFSTLNRLAAPPGAPRTLVVLPGWSQQARLAWTAPTTGGAVTSYAIQQSTNGLVWTTTATTTATSYVMSGLRNGTTYHFRVRAQNGYGGGLSAARAVAPSGIPTVVRNLQVRTWYPNAVHIGWTAPAGGSPVGTYIIQVSVDNRQWFSIGGTTATAVVVNGIQSGVRLLIRVVPRNGFGTGPASPGISVQRG